MRPQKHARTHIRSDVSEAWTAAFLVQARVTHVQNPCSMYSTTPLGASFSAMVTKGEDEYAVVARAGRTSTTLWEQENPVHKLARSWCVPTETHETVLLETLVASSASAGGIERANQEVAKQSSTPRRRTEEVHSIQLDTDHWLIPFFFVRRAACLITRRRTNHCATVRTTRRPLSSPRLCTTRTLPRTVARWTTSGTLGLDLARAWRLTSTVGTSAGGKRCRSIWRRAEKARWFTRTSDEFAGTPWAPTPTLDATRMPRERSVCITLDRQIIRGGTKGCASDRPKCTAPDCRARFGTWLAQEVLAAAKAEWSAARKGTGQRSKQCSSWCAGLGQHRRRRSHERGQPRSSGAPRRGERHAGDGRRCTCH